MKNTPAPARKIRRSVQDAAPPLGIQILTRYCFPDGTIWPVLAERVEKADALAADLLAQPASALDYYGDSFSDRAVELVAPTNEERDARAALVNYFAGFACAERIDNPEAAADEAIAVLARERQNAGFLLGMCLAYRMLTATAGGVR